jgi:hypothetical protein
MTTKTSRAVLTAVFLAATASAALFVSPVQAATPHLSKTVVRHLVAAQKALQEKDLKAAADDIAQAKAYDDRSPYDDYKIAQMEMFVDMQSQDMAGATAAAQAAADSPAQPDEEKPGNLKNAMLLSMNAKQYDKAAAYAKALEATNPTDPQTIATIGEAYYLGKDYPAAQANAQKRIDAAIQAGKVPERSALQILMSAQAAQKNEEGAEKTLEMLVADYNQPDDWQQIIDIALSTPGLRDVDAIWLGRLLFLSGATVSTADASLIGTTASHLTFFGDAVTAQQHGGTGFPDANARAQADKNTIQTQCAAIPKQKDGTYAAKLAEALYSYGMYPEAEAAAQASIAKGGNPQDPSEAQMVLGQAQAAQGKYDDALASFGKVTGGSAATPRIARLWTDYVNIKKNPPAAAAAAPAEAAPAEAAAQ